MNNLSKEYFYIYNIFDVAPNEKLLKKSIGKFEII